MEKIPLIEESDEDCDFGFIEQDNQNIQMNMRQNAELAAGCRVRQQIVQRFYS